MQTEDRMEWMTWKKKHETKRLLLFDLNVIGKSLSRWWKQTVHNMMKFKWYLSDVPETRGAAAFDPDDFREEVGIRRRLFQCQIFNKD